MRIWIWIFLFISTGTFAQSRLIVFSDKEAIVLLDTTHIKPNQFIQIDRGIHILKCWAPTKKLIVDTIVVEKDSNFYFRKKLEPTPEYAEYKKNLKTYRLQHGGLITFTAAYTCLAVIGHLNFKSKIDDQLELANAAKENYENSISEGDLKFYKSEYEDHRSSYDQYRTMDYILLGVSAVVIPLSVYGIIHFHGRPKPTYKETPQLSRFDITINSFSINHPSATIKWRF